MIMYMPQFLRVYGIGALALDGVIIYLRSL